MIKKSVIRITLCMLISANSLFAQHFQPVQNVSDFQGDPSNISLGDINLDGHTDIMISGTDNGILIYLNDGEGHYDDYTLIDHIAGTYCKFIDIDNDGDLDIYAISEGQNKAGWFNNSGNGIFQSTDYNIEFNYISSPKDLEVTDIDNDGDLDIAFVAGNNIKIGYNDGEGVFTYVNKYLSTNDDNNFIFGDLDNDGLKDIISSDIGKIYWFKNNGGTSFASQVLLSDEINDDFFYDPITYVDMFDIDGNGTEDIVCKSYSNGSSELAYFINNADGTLEDRVIISTDPYRDGVISHIDMDSDGDIDILSTGNTGHFLRWHENIECLEFTPHSIPTTISFSEQLKASDLNNDGKKDFIARGNNADVSVLISTENDQYIEQVLMDGKHTNSPYALDTADVDNDGDIDLIVSDFNDNDIVWFPNEGGKYLGGKKLVRFSTVEVRNVVAEDFTNDGLIDVAYTEQNSWNGQTIEFTKQLPNGTFNIPNFITSNVDDVTGLDAGDFNLDGYPDLVSCSYEDGKIAWYKNSLGAFGSQIVLTSNADGPQSIKVTQIDNDAYPDILFITSDDNSLSWYKNNGNETFTLNTISTTDTLVTVLDILDIDSDGDTDIITGSLFHEELKLYINNGSGSFAAPVIINEGFGYTSLAIADYNNDLLLDIAFSDGLADEVYWIENLGSNTFSTANLIDNTIDAPLRIIPLDVNQDQDMDIAISGFEDDQIYISHNNFNTQDYIKTEVCTSYTSPVGNVYSVSGEYTDTLTTVFGGDSLFIIDLDVISSDTISFNKSICFGDSINFGGTYYHTTGNYEQSLTNQCGLDSIIQLNLNVIESYETNLTDTICSSNCFNVGGNFYETTGEYTDTLSSICGFDSIVYTNLTVLDNSSPTNLDIEICVGDDYEVGGELFTSTGDYEIILVNSLGCDSIVNLELTAIFVNSIISYYNGVYSAQSQTGVSYQWVDCDNNNEPIPGATSNTFEPSQNGNYAVEITKDGCIKLSNCETSTGIGLNELNSMDISMSPNPVSDVLTININNQNADAKITITDMLGKNYFTIAAGNQTNLAVDVKHLSCGLYYVNYISNGQKLTKKIVKK